jgi:hypothetical protein
MAQLQKGTNYTATGDNSFVTHTNLNAHVTNAKLIGGAIGEQIANGVSEDADLILIKKGDDLFKQTKAEFLNTINTGSVNANTVNAEDIVVDDVIINDTVEVGGNATIDGTLEVTGATTLTGGVAGNLAVTGLVTASTVPTTGGHLTNKTYVDGTSSKTANGWVKLPNGLIMQWGTHLTAMANYSTATITFPIPFPTACFTVQLTARAVNAPAGGATLENGIKLNGVPTTATFAVYINWSGSQAGAPIYPTWFAIGN